MYSTQNDNLFWIFSFSFLIMIKEIISDSNFENKTIILDDIDSIGFKLLPYSKTKNINESIYTFKGLYKLNPDSNNKVRIWERVVDKYSL